MLRCSSTSSCLTNMATPRETVVASPSNPHAPLSSYSLPRISATETYSQPPDIRYAFKAIYSIEDQRLPGDATSLHYGAFDLGSADGDQHVFAPTTTTSRLIAVASVYLDDSFQHLVDRKVDRSVSCYYARIWRFATVQEYEEIGLRVALLDYAKVHTMDHQVKMERDPTQGLFFWLDARETTPPWYGRAKWGDVGRGVGLIRWQEVFGTWWLRRKYVTTSPGRYHIRGIVNMRMSLGEHCCYK